MNEGTHSLISSRCKGLTCTEDNFFQKAGAFKKASQLGIAIIGPDTSPRGVKVEGDSDSWDFGVAAGFYLDATEEKWAKNYRMESYITKELYQIVCTAPEFSSFDSSRMGITGHSMGWFLKKNMCSSFSNSLFVCSRRTWSSDPVPQKLGQMEDCQRLCPYCQPLLCSLGRQSVYRLPWREPILLESLRRNGARACFFVGRGSGGSD